MKYNDTHIKQKLALAAIVFTIGFIITLFTNKCHAQTAYKYYLISIAIDPKGNYLAFGQKGAKYDIDTAYAGKKFANASEIFNALAGAGLEYVNQASTASFVEAAPSEKFDFFIWKRKIQ
ncbi:MAG: hypothetical protein ACJ749_18370 [Flavisolibacter sp.]|jgi:hypothetical protein